jgi:hypothetical protein
VQAALGAVPLQGLFIGQLVRDVMPRQPLASRPQVTMLLELSHEVPAPAAQAAGGAGHEQLAAGYAPVQGLPIGHVVRIGAIATQPWASIWQVATVDGVSQNVPAPLVQPIGRGGQPHDPFAAWQVVGAGHGISGPQLGHPDTITHCWRMSPAAQRYSPGVHMVEQVLPPVPVAPPVPVPVSPPLPTRRPPVPVAPPLPTRRPPVPGPPPLPATGTSASPESVDTR